MTMHEYKCTNCGVRHKQDQKMDASRVAARKPCCGDADLEYVGEVDG